MISRHVAPHIASEIGVDVLLWPDVPLNTYTHADVGPLMMFMRVMDPYTWFECERKGREAAEKMLADGTIKIHLNVLDEE
jgi:hypothetical protein